MHATLTSEFIELIKERLEIQDDTMARYARLKCYGYIWFSALTPDVASAKSIAGVNRLVNKVLGS